MDAFEYISVLTSIILGLGMAQLLLGVSRIIQDPEHVKPYWVHLSWVLTMFIYSVFWWWWEFNLNQIEVWTFGMESDATWWLESPDVIEVGGSGLSATLRDYARFGLFLLNGGVAGGEEVLPDGWVESASTPKQVGDEKVDYGYMLWPVENAESTIHEGAYEALGIFGQQIYINPRENVVIAIWSARPKPTGKTTVNDQDFYAAVCEAVR